MQKEIWMRGRIAESMEISECCEKYALRNSVEELILAKTKSIMSRLNMCQCEKCFLDTCALVLNKLPPKYVTTDKGCLMAKVPAMDARNELELAILITQCAKMVRDNPCH